MGACTMMPMARNTRGRGRNYLPMSFTSPPQRYMYSPQALQPVSPISPINAISPTFFPAPSPTGYLEAASSKRSHDDQVVLEISQTGSAPMAIKTKSSIQVGTYTHTHTCVPYRRLLSLSLLLFYALLYMCSTFAHAHTHTHAHKLLEEICQKNNWGAPLYVLHSTSAGEDILYLYKITVTAIGVTYIPSKLSRSVEEARNTAADYALVQLGYPMEGMKKFS